jgi:triacylglycerol esterase/lipase EstA (alpha/beta hydrolase family)
MQRRHSLTQLLRRALVAAATTAATATFVYPGVNHSGVALWRAARRRRQPVGLVRAVVGEWAMASLVAAARPLGFFGLPVLRPGARGPRPVLLLHGYAMGRANFLLLANRMALAGLGPLVGFEYWTLGGVAQASVALGELVEEVCTRLGVSQVDLVGHSLGGMIARHYVSAGGGAARVAHLVTIGSPHGGTPFARFGLGRTAAEMQVGSPLLATLGARPLPASVQATAIWSRADGLVSSRAQAQLAGAEMIEVDGLGHLAMLASRRVARAVIARLSA